MGLGILGLPNVFSKFGLVPTLLLFLTAYIFSIKSSYLLIKAKNLSRRSNYCTIAKDSLGEWSKYKKKTQGITLIITFLLYLNNFFFIMGCTGTAIGEIVVLGSGVRSIVITFKYKISLNTFWKEIKFWKIGTSSMNFLRLAGLLYFSLSVMLKKLKD